MEPLDEMFRWLRTAKAWNKDPQQMRALPLDDQAMMMAYEHVTNIREIYRQQWQEDHQAEIDQWRADRRKRKSGTNAYKTMLRKMGIPG